MYYCVDLEETINKKIKKIKKCMSHLEVMYTYGMKLSWYSGILWKVYEIQSLAPVFNRYNMLYDSKGLTKFDLGCAS